MIDVPNSINHLHETHLYLNVVWLGHMCGSKSGRQKDLCFKKIRIHAQPLLLILDSVVNTKLMGEPS